MQQKKLLGAILISYYKESLVSTNLNSKLLWFHSVGPTKSLYKVAQGAIFMEKNIRFGLILGRLAILEKSLGNYEQLLSAIFSCFHGQKKIKSFLKNIVASALKSCIISLL